MEERKNRNFWMNYLNLFNTLVVGRLGWLGWLGLACFVGLSPQSLSLPTNQPTRLA